RVIQGYFLVIRRVIQGYFLPAIREVRKFPVDPFGARLSAGDAGFEVDDHVPEPIDLAALDDLQRLETVQGGIGGVEPGGDRVGLYALGEPGLQALGFARAAEARLVGGAAALPVCD